MASFNKVILVGHLTADPELKQTTSGTAVCSFSIGVNRRFAKTEQGQQSVDFINIVAWRQQAEFVTKYFTKGNPILVCGQLQTRTWTDNQGQKRYATEVVADEVSFVANATNNSSNNSAQGNSASSYVPEAYSAPTNGFVEIPTDEDLPF